MQVAGQGCELFLRRTGLEHFPDRFCTGNCSEPVLNSYASGDASHPESPDATSFTLSYALSSKCFGLS